MLLVGNKGTSTKLADILPDSEKAGSIKSIKAAIAYGSEQFTPNFIDNCKELKFETQLWMRFDHMVPVTSGLLKKIQKIQNINCRFIHDTLHSKIIWWIGYGAYIGSANLFDKAWNRGIETGLFITQEELENNMLNGQLKFFFDEVESLDNQISLDSNFINKVEKLEVEKNRWLKNARKLRKKSGLNKPLEVNYLKYSEFLAYVGTDHVRAGHFNVKSEFSKAFGVDKSSLLINTKDGSFEGVINRSAQSNGSPRIYGHDGLRKWYKQNDALRKKIRVKVINPQEILISIFEHEYVSKKRSDFNFYSIDEVINRGFLSVEDKAGFSKSVNVCNCFGHKIRRFMKGSANHLYEKSLTLWFPKLFDNLDWENKLSNNNKTLTERKLRGDVQSYIKGALIVNEKSNHKRLLFTAEKDAKHKVFYVFRGQFELDIESSNITKGLVFKRTKTKVATYPPLQK